MMLKIFFSFLFNLFISLLLFSQNGGYNVFVKQLLQEMTLEEKVGQMTLIDLPAIHNDYSELVKYNIGAVLSGGDSHPSVNNIESWVNQTDSVQSYAQKTRLKIPILYGIDAVHGNNNVVGSTIFPHNIGLGAARDTSLLSQIGQITALEMKAMGHYWTFAPCIAVPQDERWGRVYEGYSEDPILVSQLGGALMRGLQGDDSLYSVLACAKHWVGDGATDRGKDRGDATLDSTTFFDVHVYPYRENVSDGVGSVMASFSSWNTKPNHANGELINGYLRDSLGFDGFVVSDWSAIDLLPGDYYSDVVTSINAGIDMVMVPIEYKMFISTLLEAVAKGDVSEARIDEASGRILQEKYLTGLFDNALPIKELKDTVGCQSHRTLARDAVAKSCVLLKNNQILPLQNLPDTVYVLGQHADDIGMQCGGWTIGWQGHSGRTTDGETLLEALRARYTKTEFIYVNDSVVVDEVDFCIVTVGERPYAEWFGDDNELELSQKQYAFLQNARGKGAKVVSLLYSGRVLMIDRLLALSDAVVSVWLPGTEAGGIVDVISGDVDPIGKLSYTWFEDVSYLPLNSANGDEEGVLFPFGYGLTYNDISVQNHAFVVDGGNALLYSNVGDTLVAITSGGEAISIDSIVVVGSMLKVVLKERVIPGDNVVCTLKSGGTLDVYNSKSSIAVPSKFDCELFNWNEGVRVLNEWDAKGITATALSSGESLYYNVNVDVAGEYEILLRGLTSNAELRIYIDGAVKDARIIEPGWNTTIFSTHLNAGETILRVECLSGEWKGNWIAFDTFVKKKRSKKR